MGEFEITMILLAIPVGILALMALSVFILLIRLSSGKILKTAKSRFILGSIYLTIGILSGIGIVPAMLVGGVMAMGSYLTYLSLAIGLLPIIIGIGGAIFISTGLAILSKESNSA